MASSPITGPDHLFATVIGHLLQEAAVLILLLLLQEEWADGRLDLQVLVPSEAVVVVGTIDLLLLFARVEEADLHHPEPEEGGMADLQLERTDRGLHCRLLQDVHHQWLPEESRRKKTRLLHLEHSLKTSQGIIYIHS